MSAGLAVAMDGLTTTEMPAWWCPRCGELLRRYRHFLPTDGDLRIDGVKLASRIDAACRPCSKAAAKEREKVTWKVRRRIWQRDGWACVACGATEPLTVDHIRPLIRGGTNDDANLQTLCGPCNATKGKH
jgi:5-methylcytosine-specific restriction endonuclease McrA